MDLSRPDGFAASLEPLLFGKWKLAFYMPTMQGGVSFLTINGPEGSFGFLATMAAEILLEEKPCSIEKLAELEKKQVAQLFFPESIELEPQDRIWYRFEVDGGLWRVSTLQK